MEMLKIDRKLFLGTAMWGWGVDKKEAFNILDIFAENGGLHIDTASNYPIDKVPEHYGLAIDWLSEWLLYNGRNALKILAKIGSVDNSGSDSSNLSPQAVDIHKDYLTNKLGDSLSCICIHWDNRGIYDEIAETIGAFKKIKKEGLSIGLSGISRPDVYFNAAPELDGEWIIQAKNNIITTKPIKKYLEYFTKSRFLAYGINMGGLKREFDEASSMSLRGIQTDNIFLTNIENFLLSDHSLDPKPTSLNELSLFLSYMNPKLDGVIIGPRTVKQLLNTTNYWNALLVKINKIDHVFYEDLIYELTKNDN